MAPRKTQKCQNKTKKPLAKQKTKSKRTRYPIHVKQHAQRLKDQGLTLTQMIDWFKKEMNLVIKKSTICTWYNNDNVEKFKGLGVVDKDTLDTCYTPSQRPAILHDLERVLKVHIIKSQSVGMPMTQMAIRYHALTFFDRLKTLQIYDNNGARRPNCVVLSQSYIDCTLRVKPDVPKVTNPDDPLYENSEDMETNQLVVSSLPTDDVRVCTLCPKLMGNYHAFLDHVMWHTIQNVENVAATLDLEGTPPLPNPTPPPTPTPKDLYHSFKASAGWCSNFIARNKLGSYTLSGEKASNDYEKAKAFKKDFTTYMSLRPEITVETVIQVVINCDEGGLQYRSIPQRGYVSNDVIIKAKKPIKSRVTLMFCSTMHGHKFKLVVIGQSKNPRCFKKMNKSLLPVHYYNNKTAWMTREFFFDWFISHFEPEVSRLYPGKTIHLLMDNCRAHPPKDILDSLFPNIKVWMLPPNTTAIIQPMDQGIIMTAKSRFKKNYYKQLQEFNIESHCQFEDPVAEFMKQYTLLDAINDIDQAWQSISKRQLHKSFEEVIDIPLFLENKLTNFEIDEPWLGYDFSGFDNQHVIAQRNRDTISTLTAANSEEPTAAPPAADEDDGLDQVVTNINNLLLQVAACTHEPAQCIDLEALKEDISYDPFKDLEMDHEITEVLSSLQITDDDYYELEELEEPCITTPNPIVTIFSSFNNFKRISNNLTQDFTAVDQTLYQKLTDDMNDLLYRYLKHPVPTDKNAEDLLDAQDLLDDLPDINPNPQNINVDNTLDLPGPSHEDVPLRRVPSSGNVTTFRQIRGFQHDTDNDNWKRNIKKEKPVEELDSDTDTVLLVCDESDDDPDGFVNEPDDDPDGFVNEPDATGSNDGTNWSTSPGVGTQNLSYELSLDLTHDEFVE